MLKYFYGDQKQMKKALTFFAAVFILVFIANSASAAIAPATPQAGSTFDQRLALRKAEQKITLDPKVQERLIQKCRAAQTVITTLIHDTEPIINNRNSTYQKIDAKLWVMIGQLKLAKKDTFKFEQQHSEYVKKIAAFQATGTNFRQSLDDLVVINCQADIIGFKAILETARAYYTQLYNQTADNNNYVLNTVKPTIDDFITQLTPKTNPN